MPSWTAPVLLAVLGVLVVVLIDSGRGRGPRSDDEHWFGGLIYYNRGDSRTVVPKRYGFGRTLNYARPLAWVLTVLPIVIGAVAAHK
ncbi:hypothetical protein KGQ20_34415 [Catenulispora sp. NF23]|uniref:DUF5808 domain-containing protein n=1 Tax=Catenulispora pinistramenti TaxID=2705254 RepID=A0ABS5KSZ1_9ACTN|nr:DUF5808 domain-containing protein [Catenulispora pinistramenti]MBS2537860.1 hypothetical protein [Catenulispora pinistramenti]MBS2549144.1 hypothetical protein [Catenulispora pinistramenti]